MIEESLSLEILVSIKSRNTECSIPRKDKIFECSIGCLEKKNWEDTQLFEIVEELVDHRRIDIPLALKILLNYLIEARILHHIHAHPIIFMLCGMRGSPFLFQPLLI